MLVTWERAKDGHLAPQGDGETGNKRKKGVQRACSPGKGQPKGTTIGSELLGGKVHETSGGTDGILKPNKYNPPVRQMDICVCVFL